MDLAALITSIVAIIVALISGAFTMAAAKRTAKAQKATSYIAILQEKVNKLTDYIKTTVQLTGPTSTVTNITKTFERIWAICVDEPTLFTECYPKFQELELKRKEIKELRDQVRLLNGLKTLWHRKHSRRYASIAKSSTNSLRPNVTQR